MNNPPSNVDHQKVSNSLASFIKLKDQTKAGKVWKKKIQHPEKEPFNKNKVPAKKIPYLKKQVNENDRDFAIRVKRVTKESLNEAQFEAKYGVDVVRNSKTGEIQIKKRPKNDILAKKKKAGEVVTKLTTSEKLKLKKINIKEKKLKKRELNETEYKRDEFIFGEVVHGPPELSTPKHGKKPETTAKVSSLIRFLLKLKKKKFVFQPGKKGLLLNTMMKREDQGTSDVKPNSSSETEKNNNSGKVDLKGKRKDLPAATRERLDRAQQDTVEMYRQLKKKKFEESLK